MQKKPLFLALLAGLALSGAAQATLTDNGGGLVYDSVLNITWLQNANLAATDTFGVAGIGADGSMSWTTANAWIAAMNAADYLGQSNWRLPTVAPINGSTFNYNYSVNGSTDVGFNVSAPGTAYAGSTGSEMAYLFFNELDNKAYYNTTGTLQAGYGVTNTGPFQNLQSSVYWSGLGYAQSPGSAWVFLTYIGEQGYGAGGYDAMAVLPGNVAAVPEADAWAMLLAGLGLVGVAMRRRRG